MNIKVFNIRLNKEFCQRDQDRMNKFLETVEVKLTSTNFVTTNTTDYWSVAIFYTPKKKTKARTEFRLIEEDLSQEKRTIFIALRKWRNDLADKLEWNSFRICHNSHLMSIAKAKPVSKEALEKVSSFGKVRTIKYGDDISAVLNAL